MQGEAIVLRVAVDLHRGPLTPDTDKDQSIVRLSLSVPAQTESKRHSVSSAGMGRETGPTVRRTCFLSLHLQMPPVSSQSLQNSAPPRRPKLIRSALRCTSCKHRAVFGLAACSSLSCFKNCQPEESTRNDAGKLVQPGISQGPAAGVHCF